MSVAVGTSLLHVSSTLNTRNAPPFGAAFSFVAPLRSGASGRVVPRDKSIQSQFSAVAEDCSQGYEGRGEPVQGALKVLTLALQTAIAWTLLSLLLSALRALVREVWRRFGSRRTPNATTREERSSEVEERSSEVRVLYAEFCEDDLVNGDASRFELSRRDKRQSADVSLPMNDC